MANERYKVIEGSESGHCCFEATIVDTSKPHPVYAGKHEWVCECLSTTVAHHIASVLNNALVNRTPWVEGEKPPKKV